MFSRMFTPIMHAEGSPPPPPPMCVKDVKSSKRCVLLNLRLSEKQVSQVGRKDPTDGWKLQKMWCVCRFSFQPRRCHYLFYLNLIKCGFCVVGVKTCTHKDPRRIKLCTPGGNVVVVVLFHTEVFIYCIWKESPMSVLGNSQRLRCKSRFVVSQ